MNLDSPRTIVKTTIQAPTPRVLTKKWLRIHFGISVQDRRGKLYRLFEADGIFNSLPQLLAAWPVRREFTPAETRVIAEIWKIETV
jgi:hypothetical protein